VLDLLRCYRYHAGRSSITQGNLMMLEGKIKTMLAGGPSMAGSNAFHRSKGLIATQASTSGRASGEARVRCDAVAWEGILQSLSGASGDSAADILVVLFSEYSVFRRALVGRAPATSHQLLSRVAALASEWATYSAKRIAGADVCAVGAYDRAVLSNPLARSLLDCSIFASFKAVCAPLAALHVRPYAEIQRLATSGRVHSHEALVYIHRAYSPLFADLSYGGWDELCGNLLTLIGINDQTHCKLTDSVGLLISTDLRHVAGIVKGHFDSSSLDGKVKVPFGCDAAQRILAKAYEASRLLGQYVLLRQRILSTCPEACAPRRVTAFPLRMLHVTAFPLHVTDFLPHGRHSPRAPRAGRPQADGRPREGNPEANRKQRGGCHAGQLRRAGAS
jgi:hypothetical protein